MGIRCKIGKREKDGTIRAIYCFHYGHPGSVGKILNSYYNTSEKINTLLSFGDLSILGIQPKAMEATNMSLLGFADTNDEGFPIFCHRAAINEPAEKFKNRNSYLNSFGDASYYYIFENNNWTSIKK